MAEAIPGFESNTWFGLYGPKGLPDETISKISMAVNQTLFEVDVKERLAKLGIESVGGTPLQFAQMVAVDAAKWKRIIAERQIVTE